MSQTLAFKIRCTACAPLADRSQEPACWSHLLHSLYTSCILTSPHLTLPHRIPRLAAACSSGCWRHAPPSSSTNAQQYGAHHRGSQLCTLFTFELYSLSPHSCRRGTAAAPRLCSSEQPSDPQDLCAVGVADSHPVVMYHGPLQLVHLCACLVCQDGICTHKRGCESWYKGNGASICSRLLTSSCHVAWPSQSLTRGWLSSLRLLQVRLQGSSVQSIWPLQPGAWKSCWGSGTKAGRAHVPSLALKPGAWRQVLISGCMLLRLIKLVHGGVTCLYTHVYPYLGLHAASGRLSTLPMGSQGPQSSDEQLAH